VPSFDRPHIVLVHAEDDPMEKHDHPLSRERLGDNEAGLGAAATLTVGDADALRQLPGVQFVAEGVHENAHVVAGSKRWFTRLHGSDVDLPSIRRSWSFSAGRFFTRREQSKAAQVVVIGSIVAQKLFGITNPVGKTLTIWKQPFEIVGVLTSSSWMVAPATGDDQFDAVYVPITTVHKLLNLTKLNDITLTAASTGDVTRLSEDVTRLMRVRHRIRFKDPDDFTVATQARKALARGGLRQDVARAVVGNVAGLDKVTLEQLAKTLERASRTMTALLGSIAGVSLLVGGIGIMNIMLLSVTERTREIGIRRAVARVQAICCGSSSSRRRRLVCSVERPALSSGSSRRSSSRARCTGPRPCRRSRFSSRWVWPVASASSSATIRAPGVARRPHRVAAVRVMLLASFRIAVRALGRHKLRTALTTLE